MNREELLFYTEYEEFYEMARKSASFQMFCKDAFGEDFSQDGFSDVNQINMILQYIPKRDNVRILDIGCGNGKMLGYLQKMTGVHIYGFDYSSQAIKDAKAMFEFNSEFKEGIIGEIDYPAEKFDVIVSMDSIYFSKDMAVFVSQVKRWLKKDGVFFIGYQEGEVMPKTQNRYTTEIAIALEKNAMKFEVKDITKQTYEMLNKKREKALLYKNKFVEEGYEKWNEMLLGQTECAKEPYEIFRKKMARYIYVARK